MAQTALWLLVLLPAVVGGALALSRSDRAAAAVSLATAALTAALAVVVALARPQVAMPFMAGSDLALGVDALSALVVPTVAFVTLLALVFSTGEIGESQARFHGLMLLFASGALMTATAQTLPPLLFAWEVMGATSFALVGFWWREEHRVSAGVTAFVTTRAADVGIYLAAGAALAGGAGLALADLPDGSEGWRHVAAAGVLVAALGKAAQLPFSFWLSRAMEGPSSVSALLHSAAMVAMGGYLLLRAEPLLASTGWAAPATAWVGALTALLLGAVALAQRDLKQLLAASTSAQLGFVVMGAGLASVSGGAAHLVAHASTKALLFLAAGAWLTALGTRRLTGLLGVARRWPLVGWTSTLGLLSLAGVAPLALWATKDAVLAAALETSPWLYAVGVAAAALAAAYAGKVLVLLWRRAPEPERAVAEGHHDEEEQGTRRVGLPEQAPLVVLAFGAALLGLLALPPVGDTVARALGEEPVHPAPLEMALSAVVALVVLALVWWRPAPEPAWLRGWLGLEVAAHTLVVRPTVALAESLARFDDRVLDRVVTGSAEAVLGMARRAATFDDRVLDGVVETTAGMSVRAAERAGRVDGRWLDGAVEGVATATRRLGRLARRPQTGQLHQYYVQAIAVLAVGVLLLVMVR
ncbi:proton-conducting transporter transmembrane domain-containing protein [Ornithinimicrobium sediminis]|uniref:proton-conducting transporter transmembrane domain-containing protein n=1 Tax=Ornithinimicrobium sediminis TaxID=2904603 RepID=UPI001E31C51C|nr:proton-conducting transporter membrane subunit [Ornithinimicrobium sediminis]MCE0487735.1 NADH-quinone oxidoreductase subunit L [Ornithinimicrobium sediminis]